MRRRRCAIYTRKSSEEGLDQSFNSLDAQREACLAYIASQRQEGWEAVKEPYDDGGYSGGTLDRPALQRLIEAIKAGQIDTIVVYKVDRLTRSLSDFAKLVEIFDAHQTAFVSVTQQFNTTSSMGRLTLNVLLSFAQFEREVTGERIRDKIGASKKKGLWMGGNVPIGYDCRDRKLIVNRKDAVVVNQIFRRYAQLRCVSKLRMALREAGVRTKVRVSESGKRWGGVPFSRGALYALLHNRVYRGEIRHKGACYPGQHPAIVPETLWNKVQKTLAENRRARKNGAAAQHPSLLAGLVYDDAGNRLTPTHTARHGRRYRYYVSQKLIQRAPGSTVPGLRVPAKDLEEAVIRTVRQFIVNTKTLKSVLAAAGVEISAPSLAGQSERLIKRWERERPAELRDSLSVLLKRVSVLDSRIEVVMNIQILRAALAHGHQHSETIRADVNSDSKTDVLHTLACPCHLRRAGNQRRQIVPSNSLTSIARPNAPLIKTIVRAMMWYERLVAEPDLMLWRLAKLAGVNERQVRRELRYAFVPPDLLKSILDGRQLHQITSKYGANLLPLHWTDSEASPRKLVT